MDLGLKNRVALVTGGATWDVDRARRKGDGGRELQPFRRRRRSHFADREKPGQHSCAVRGHGEVQKNGCVGGVDFGALNILK